MDTAEKFFDEMISDGIEPDVVVYNVLIAGFGKLERLEKCTQILEDMKKKDIEPTLITYTSLINACAYAKNMDKALDYLNTMKKMLNLPYTLIMHY
eukprot:UN34016